VLLGLRISTLVDAQMMVAKISWLLLAKLFVRRKHSFSSLKSIYPLHRHLIGGITEEAIKHHLKGHDVERFRVIQQACENEIAIHLENGTFSDDQCCVGLYHNYCFERECGFSTFCSIFTQPI